MASLERRAVDTRRTAAEARRAAVLQAATTATWRDRWKDLPAWLTSMVLHIVLMLLLAIPQFKAEPSPDTITLATSFATHEREGDAPLTALPVETPEFDSPGNLEPDPILDENPFGQMEDVEGLDPKPAASDSGPTADNPVALSPAEVNIGRPLAGRNPQVRQQILRAEGGTTETELAVARGLEWLARHQSPVGNWRLDDFHVHETCRQQCGGRGLRSDVAGTALALLPFLGAGQTPHAGKHAETVKRGLEWLLKAQREDGDLRSGEGRMYSHGIASIVLCEAYALTYDDKLRAAAQRAVDFIIRAQERRGGGWRYDPGMAGDTSVLGWQIMALRSAEMAGLEVPRKAFYDALRFLDDVQTDDIGSRYGYMPGSERTPVMTAEALLCRQFLGWPHDHPGMKAGADYLAGKHLPDFRETNMYYWYYGTQVLHHLGGENWSRWNAKMKQVLLKTQDTRGHAAGSWSPVNLGGKHGSDRWGNSGGRIYTTSLAVCTLEVYYRHLPLYRKTAVDEKAASERGESPK